MGDRLADPNSPARLLLIIGTIWFVVLVFGAAALLTALHPRLGFLPPAPTVRPSGAPTATPLPTANPNPVAMPGGAGASNGQGTLTGTGANRGSAYPPGEPPGDVEDDTARSSSGSRPGSSPRPVIPPLPLPTHVLPSVSPLPGVP